MSSEPSSEGEYLPAEEDWTDEVDDEDDELDLEEMIRLGGADMLDELQGDDDEDDEDDDYIDEEGVQVADDDDEEEEEEDTGEMDNLVLSEEAVRVLSGKSLG